MSDISDRIQFVEIGKSPKITGPPDGFNQWLAENLANIYRDARSTDPCPYCKSPSAHLHNCLEIMNRMRTPTGDWWKI